MQTGSSGTLIGWKSGQTTFDSLWDRMEGAWLWTLGISDKSSNKRTKKVSDFQYQTLYGAPPIIADPIQILRPKIIIGLDCQIVKS
jgi:hypothetical protein